jgi:2Fe-2S ferredoxin
MAVINVIDRDGKESLIESDTGYSLKDILINNNYDVAAICGGVCSCATCHVLIDTPWVDKIPPRSADEQVLVEESEAYVTDQSRLGCQVEFTSELDGVQVTIAPED